VDTKDLLDQKRGSGFVLCQDIREFEQKTGMEFTGIKIKRDEQGIESVTLKAEIPDTGGA
jgi:hypothetical protein